MAHLKRSARESCQFTIMTTTNEIAGLIPTELTLATPECSSLSAADAQPAITAVSSTLPRPSSFETPEKMIRRTTFVTKHTHRGFRKWHDRWTRDMREVTSNPDRKDESDELAVIGLVQAVWWYEHFPRDPHPWTEEDFPLAPDIDWRLNGVVYSALQQLDSTYRTWHGRLGCLRLHDTRMKTFPFLQRAISTNLQLKALKEVLGGRAMKFNYRHRSHMLRCLFVGLIPATIAALKVPESLKSKFDEYSNVMETTPNWTPTYSRAYDGLLDLMEQAVANPLQGRLQSLFSVDVNIKTEDVSRLLNDIKEHLSHLITSSWTVAKNVLMGVALALLIWNIVDLMFKMPTCLDKCRIFLQLLSPLLGLYLAVECARVVTKCIQGLVSLGTESNLGINPLGTIEDFKEPVRGQLQSGKSENSVLGLLSLATLTLLTGKDKWNVNYLTKQIAALPRFSQGVTCIVEAFHDIAKVLHREIAVDIFGYAPWTDDGQHPMINRFNDLMCKITKVENESKIVNSSILQAEVLEAEQLGLKIIQSPGLGEYRSAVTTQYHHLRRLTERLGLRGQSNKGQRLAPVILMLYGCTGQGKSAAVDTLALKLLSKICEAENIDKTKIDYKNLIYARNQEQEFWDGYHGQLITVYDDFAQQRDFAQAPNLELFEIIRAGNTFEYPLHMADIADKNTTTFQSRIVILTTNAKKPKIESLYAPEAVYRRIDSAWEVRYSPEVSDEVEIDGKKVAQLREEFRGKYNTNLQEFSKYDVCTGEYSPRNARKSLEHVVQDVFMKYKARFAFDQSRHQSNQELAQSLGFHTTTQGWKNPIRAMQHKVASALGYRPDLPAVGWTADEDEWHDAVEISLPELCHLREQYDAYCAKLNLWRENLKKKMSEHAHIFKALAFAGMAIGAFALGKNLISLFKSESKQLESYSPRPRGMKRESAYTPSPRASRSAYAKVAQNQAADIGARNLAVSITQKSMYSISVDNDILGCGIFLVGKLFVFPRHFLTHMKAVYEDQRSSRYLVLAGENTTSKVVIRSPTHHYEMLLKDLLNSVQVAIDDVEDKTRCKDLVVVPFVTAHDHRDITSHFATKKEQVALRDADALLVNLMQNGEVCTSTMAMCNANGLKQVIDSKRDDYFYANELDYDDNVVTTYARDYWMYKIATVAGDCGGMLLANNNMVQRKILGMHIMGGHSIDEGVAMVLTSEEIKSIVDKFKDKKKFTIDTVEYPVESGLQNLSFRGEFIPVGISKEIHITPPSSKIQKSPLHPDRCEEAWRESVSRPALLHPIVVNGDDSMPFENGTRFDPMKYRLEKCGLPAKSVDQELLDEVVQSYVAELRQVCARHTKDHYKSEYSFEEAVLGIAGDPYVQSINRSTAPGYGWKPEPGKPGKQTWFGSEAEFDLSKAEPVKKRVEETIELAKQGIRNSHVFIDTLKDERKPKAKWWKTRVFSACSQDYYIACKQYFQGVVGLLTRNRIRTGICVGVNVYSEEWDLIVKHLFQCAEDVVAGDFENFDSSLLTQILDAACTVLNELCEDLEGFDPIHNDIRTVLFHDLVHSVHLAKNEMYAWTHSLPSGHYLTAIVNSIYVNIVFRYLLALVMKVRGPKLDRLLRKLKLVSYGDDHVVAIPKECVSVFNQNTLPELFRQIGMGYTDETKSESRELSDTRTIDHVTFLKRGFRFEPKLNRWVAPLSLDTVLETPFWVKKGKSPVDITKQNVTWACHELALHDDDVFRDWTKKMQLACKRVLNWMPHLSLKRVDYIQLLSDEFECLAE